MLPPRQRPRRVKVPATPPEGAARGKGEYVFRTRFLCLFGAALTALAFAAPSLGDVKITDRQYVTHEGGQDATTIACSANNRQQNEPAAAVSPTQPAKMTAGANDYCTTPTNGDAWAGFYFSSDSGSTWTNSLLPGYPLDTTAEGQASPLHGLALAAGDPVQAWDRFGNVYYGGIAFNRGQACERLDLGRALQLGRGRHARPPAHGDRGTRHPKSDLPRSLPRQGDDRGRPEPERCHDRKRLCLLGAIHRQRAQQRRFLLSFD